MKVFVVTHGEYSDFGISAMFSSKEKAQEYINKRMVYDNGYFGVNQYISEYELDVATIPRSFGRYLYGQYRWHIFSRKNVSQ